MENEFVINPKGRASMPYGMYLPCLSGSLLHLGHRVASHTIKKDNMRLIFLYRITFINPVGL